LSVPIWKPPGCLSFEVTGECQSTTLEFAADFIDGNAKTIITQTNDPLERFIGSFKRDCHVAGIGAEEPTVPIFSNGRHSCFPLMQG
jgi:hypothetical protein